MLTALICATVVLLGLGFLAAIMTLRDADQHRHFIWSVVGVVSFALGGLSLIGLLRETAVSTVALVWVAVVLVVVGLIFWLALIFIHGASRKADHDADPGAGQATGSSAGHGTNWGAADRGTNQGAADQSQGPAGQKPDAAAPSQHQSTVSRDLSTRLRFAMQVALPGWKSLDTSQFQNEDRRAASRISTALNIGAGLVVIPGVALVLGASIIMNINSSETSDFVSHAVGFYTLLVATCWTVTYLVTISLVVFFQIMRGNGSELTVTRAAVSVGTWAGFGAAGGVFVGALVPLIVVPLSSGHYELLGISLLDSVSPTLLLDISAAGAVFGFLLGEIVSLVSISAGEQNLYLKAVAAPLVFATVATLLGLVGLTPGKLASVLASEYKRTVLQGVNTDSVDPFKTAIASGLDSQKGWAMAVSGFAQKGWNQMVDEHVFCVLTWLVALMVLLFAFAFEVRQREEKLMGPRKGSARVHAKAGVDEDGLGEGGRDRASKRNGEAKVAEEDGSGGGAGKRTGEGGGADGGPRT